VPSGSGPPSRSSRAVVSAASVASDAPDVTMPPAPSGRSKRRQNQRITACSIATSAGAVSATPVKRLTVCARVSASTELSSPPAGK
jgi:hypothetical protein